MIPKVELISIGNEILAGYTVNTNSSFLSQSLQKIGLNVNWVTTISDEEDEIINALKISAERAQLVICTGGLGPTPDDITKKTIAKFFNQKLIRNEIVLQNIKNLFKARRRNLSEANIAQSMIPEKAEILPNQNGTAPGMILKKEEVIFVFMPGVPLEMKSMVKNDLIDYLKNHFNLPEVKTRILRTTGIAESSLMDLIQDIIDEYPQFLFSFLPKHIGVDLRFKLADHKDEKAWLEMIEKIGKRAQKYIFSDDERNLEQVIVELLTENKYTLAVAESFTGGLLGDWITNVPGSSEIFLGGTIAYSNQAKMYFLKVKKETLQKYGAVSSATALEMAGGVQKVYKTDCAIATTGIAGPGGATENKDIGLAYVAARFKEKEIVKEFHFGKDRRINKMRGAMAGLELLRRLILNI